MYLLTINEISRTLLGLSIVDKDRIERQTRLGCCTLS